MKAVPATALKAQPEAPPMEETADAAVWPGSDGARVVFLLDASGELEAKLLKRWVERHAPENAGPWATVRIPPSRRPRERRLTDRALDHALAAGDDPLLAPLRVIWLARNGAEPQRGYGLLKLLLTGDPY